MKAKEFEKKSVDLLINKFWHSLVDKDSEGTDAIDNMETQNIHNNIKSLEILYKIKSLFEN